MPLVNLDSMLRMAVGFGAPNRRKRVFLVASLHGDARDVLLSQVKNVSQHMHGP